MSDGGRGRNRPNASAGRAPLASYYRGSAKQASPFQKKVAKRPLSNRLVKAVDILIVLILLFCLVYSLVINPDPKIITNSNLYQPNYIYQSAAAKQIDKLKDRTKLTFDESELVLALDKQFPEIAEANVELPLFGQKPIIRLNIAQPKFILKSNEVNYVISAEGVVVSKDLSLPGTASLPVVKDKSGFSAQLGRAVLSRSQVSFINQVILQCRRSGVQISSMTLPANSQELDLKTKDKKYYVKFYLGGDALVQSGQFLAARNQFASSDKDPGQYLDVRIPGKIFYR